MHESTPTMLDTHTLDSFTPRQRTFYRWALSLAWVAISVAGFGFLPAFKHWSSWFFTAAVLLSSPWFFMVSAGIAGGPATRKPELRFAPPRILLRLAFPAIFIVGSFGFHPNLSPNGQIAVMMFDAVVVAIGAIGTVSMCGCYVIWLIPGNYELATSWLRFGITLVAWSIVLSPVSVVFLPR